MELVNSSIIPAIVIKSNDPDKLGRIKCAAPGVFDPETMPEETLPWVYPFTMQKYQSFSKLLDGSKVWLITNNENLNEYWYIPMFEYIDSTKKYLTENFDKNAEVVFLRNNGDGISAITYDDAAGINMIVGNNNINIKPTGDIFINGADSRIKIEGNKIYTGLEGGTYEPNVLGNKLVQVLSDLSSNFGKLAQMAQANPYTNGLTSGFMECQKGLADVQKILSENTYTN